MAFLLYMPKLFLAAKKRFTAVTTNDNIFWENNKTKLTWEKNIWVLKIS